MKVIYLTAFEFNGSNAASKRVINNINALTNQGMNVTVLSAGSFKSFEELNKIKRPFKSICIYEKPSHKEKLTLFDRFLGIFKAFNLLKESKDITHIILYSGYSPYAFMLLILRQFKKFKIIFDSVEWYLPNHALDVLSLKNIDSNLANRFLLHYFDGIFAISKYLEDHFKKGIFLTKKAKILLLPPLIEEKEYLHKDLILNNSLELVYAGNIGPNKDRLENVFKALFLLLDEGYQIKFTLVGDNEKNLSKIEYYVLVKGHFPESLKVINNIENKEIFVIGGGEIYKKFLEKGLIDKMYITHIGEYFDGDTFFPEVNYESWKSSEILEHSKDEVNPHDFKIIVYDKLN